MFTTIPIEGSTPVALPSPLTTGTVTSCSVELEIELLDCKYGTNYTTLSLRITNNGASNCNLRLYGGNSGYAYDDQGYKLSGSNMSVALSGDGYSAGYTSTEIPAGIFTNASIHIKNVDSSSILT